MNVNYITLSNGLRIAVSEKPGENGTLVLLHGNSSSSHIFKSILDNKSIEQRVLAIDLPGHGYSDRSINPSKDYGMIPSKKIVIDVINKLSLDNYILAGNSLGGHIAMEIAPVLKELKGLLIFGAPPLKSPINIEEAFLPNDVLAPFLTEHTPETELDNSFNRIMRGTELSKFIKSGFLNTDPKVRSAILNDLNTLGAFGDEADIVLNLEVPIYVIHGLLDLTVNFDYIKKLLKNSSAKIFEIDNCGHYPTIESPQLFISHLTKILGEVYA